MQSITDVSLMAETTVTSKLGSILCLLKCMKDAVLSKIVCTGMYFFLTYCDYYKIIKYGYTLKLTQRERQECMQREANQDQSNESAGQASGGSQLDWCTAVAACIIQTGPILSFPFLQPCKRAQTQHMDARKEGRRRNGRRVSNEDVQ